MSLDPVAKEVWCEALRSGEFKQGRGRLKYAGHYCCLGVAREVFPWLRRGVSEVLGTESCDMLGLSTESHCKLARMNDSGSTFEQIADYIEREL